MHTPNYLKILDLSGNNFSGIPSTLGESHALEILYFNNNPLQYLAKSKLVKGFLKTVCYGLPNLSR